MKPAELIAKEIAEKFNLDEELANSVVQLIRKEIVGAIHQDRLAVRKKCAEVARNNFYGIEEICITSCSIALHKYQRDVAKAIEEMEL